MVARSPLGGVGPAPGCQNGSVIDLRTAEQLAFDDVVAVAGHRDLLRVRGADAASYLHGQVSQDVEGLAVGASSWTLLLQPQGKVDAWLRLHRRAEDEFWLDVDAGFGPRAKERLDRFKLRVDAEIELRTVPALMLRGPNSQRSAQDAADALVGLSASWGGLEGVDLIDPALLDQPDDVSQPDVSAWLPAGVAQGPAETVDLLRVRQGLPAMGRELDESTIPAAAGIVEPSVDFTKGCYVGQELVARIDSRGNNTPTRLYGLRFVGPEIPDVGAELTLDDSVAGRVTTVAVSPSLGPIGLAYLRRAVEVPASLVATSPDGRSQTVEAIELPDPAG